MGLGSGPGVCPGCGSGAAVGEPCGERVCARWGLRHIPADCVTWAEHETPPPHIGRVLGKALIVRVLGAGGFGTVYLGLQLPVLMPVAVKLLHRHDDPHILGMLLKKFEGEARALARLNHPNIVRLVDYGDADGSPYLAMEFVPGSKTLKSEIAERALKGEGVTHAEARAIVRQTNDGLAAAHREGLLHRDVKPENLMLQEVEGNPLLVRIVDFGLAKFTEERTSTSRAMGTPAYMAPEQLLQKNLGPWTDLYALGAVAFELLTGRRPFPGRTSQEIVAKKVDPAYDPLSRIADVPLPDEVRAFLRRSLARDPAERYCSGGAFREALERALDAFDEGWENSTGPLDVSGLLDSSDLARVGAEKRRIEGERRRLDTERAALAEERRRFEEERRALAVAPVGQAFQPAANPDPVPTHTLPLGSDLADTRAVLEPRAPRPPARSEPRSPSQIAPPFPVTPGLIRGPARLELSVEPTDADLPRVRRLTPAAWVAIGTFVLAAILGLMLLLRDGKGRVTESPGGPAAAETSPPRPSSPSRGEGGEGAAEPGPEPEPAPARPSVVGTNLAPAPGSEPGFVPEPELEPKPEPEPKPELEPKLEPGAKPAVKPAPTPKPAPKPVAKPVPKPVAKPAPLSVRVVSDPTGARVSLNGTSVCKTPCAVRFSGDGPFTLRVDAQAFKAWTKRFGSRVDVQALKGRLEARLEMDL